MPLAFLLKSPQVWQQRVLPLLTPHLAATPGGALAVYLMLHDGAANVSLLEVRRNLSVTHRDAVAASKLHPSAEMVVLTFSIAALFGSLLLSLQVPTGDVFIRCLALRTDGANQHRRSS